MARWDRTNASLQTKEQGPASRTISPPSTICLSLTIQGMYRFLSLVYQWCIRKLKPFQTSLSLRLKTSCFLCCFRDRTLNQLPREAVGPWLSPDHGPGPPTPGPLPEGETEAMSNAQRSTLKWEKEETLGELATVAPVLYTNVNFPNLQEEYPGWCFQSSLFCSSLAICSGLGAHKKKYLVCYVRLLS